MTKLIKKYDYRNLRIKAVGFYTSNINAYLGTNIYENYDDNRGFYYWHKNAKYYQTTNNNEIINWDYVFDADIVVVSQKSTIDEEEHPDFNCYYFDGASFFEYTRYEDFPSQIFISKKIDKGE